MDLEPSAHNWEEDASDPSQNSSSQSSKTIPQTPSSPKKAPATPKRKRKNNSNATKKPHGTAPKRPSPLRQVTTIDSLDPSTPSEDDSPVAMRTPSKRLNPTSEKPTPRAIIKGVAGFDNASPDEIEAPDLTAEELEGLFGESPSKRDSALPVSLSPTSTDLTRTPVKVVSEAADSGFCQERCWGSEK